MLGRGRHEALPTHDRQTSAGSYTLACCAMVEKLERGEEVDSSQTQRARACVRAGGWHKTAETLGHVGGPSCPGLLTAACICCICCCCC